MRKAGDECVGTSELVDERKWQCFCFATALHIRSCGNDHAHRACPSPGKILPRQPISSFQNKVLNELRGDTAEQQREEFRQLSCYVDLLHKEDPLGHFTMQVDDTILRFERLFICPSASQSALLHTPRFIALDGTYAQRWAIGLHLQNYRR